MTSTLRKPEPTDDAETEVIRFPEDFNQLAAPMPPHRSHVVHPGVVALAAHAAALALAEDDVEEMWDNVPV